MEIPELARLFPLANCVLFPQALLPLHIFEPRYRQMTEDALESDRTIALVLPKEWPADEPVPIHQVACLGTIHNETKLPDGRHTFLLRGVARARIVEELPSNKLYRIARVEPCPDVVSTRNKTRRRVQRARAITCLRPVLEHGNSSPDEFLKFLAEQCSSSVFTDLISFWAPIAIERKQDLLAEKDVDRRLEILTEALGGNSPPPPPSFPAPVATN